MKAGPDVINSSDLWQQEISFTAMTEQMTKGNVGLSETPGTNLWTHSVDKQHSSVCRWVFPAQFPFVFRLPTQRQGR